MRRQKIGYAHLDFRPVRWTLGESWWIPREGEPWRPTDHADALHNGRVMPKRDFERLFPKLPKLPRAAFKP
jgi:hypothetical protein